MSTKAADHYTQAAAHHTKAAERNSGRPVTGTRKIYAYSYTA